MKFIKHASGRNFRYWIIVVIFLQSPVYYACSQSNMQSSPNCEYVENGFGPEGSVDVRAETVVAGLEVPWSLAFLPNGDLLVTERPGRLRLVRNYTGSATLVETPVATFRTASTSEGGLLGLALHPDFKRNRLFYVYVTVEDNGIINRVEQWKLSDEGTSAEKV